MYLQQHLCVPTFTCERLNYIYSNMILLHATQCQRCTRQVARCEPPKYTTRFPNLRPIEKRITGLRPPPPLGERPLGGWRDPELLEDYKHLESMSREERWELAKQIGKDAVLHGADSCIEIWNPKRFEERSSTAVDAAGSFEDLADGLFRGEA